MIKTTFKKMVTAMALSLSLALTVPGVLPLATVSNVATVEAAKSPTINQKSATLLAGQTLKLKVSNKGKNSIKWSTNKSKVATVKNGTVTAVGKGTAVITAKVGNKKLKCKVTVKANEFKVSKMDMELLKGKTGLYANPYHVYYKNGKLYCTSEFINKKYTYTIKKITNSKKKDQLKMTLSARIFTDLTMEKYQDIVLATGTIKKGLPKNIAYNSKKSFTIEFSGSQIKKKGFDLKTADDMILTSESFYVWY